MNATLTVHELDPAQFPELDREPGIYGIELSLHRPGADTRLAAPKGARALLMVSFTLPSAQLPWGSRFELEALGLMPDGKERRRLWRLVPPAPRHDNHQPLDPDPDPPPPGALDRGVFWVDLSQALREGDMRPGDTLTVRVAKAQASLKLPAGTPR